MVTDQQKNQWEAAQKAAKTMGTQFKHISSVILPKWTENWNNSSKTVWTCKHCNQIVEPLKIVLEDEEKTELFRRREICPCPTAQFEAEEARKAEQDQDWRTRAYEIIKPLETETYKDFRFGKQWWDDSRQNGKAGQWRQAIQSYAQNLNDDNMGGLYVVGDYGTGKTHLSIAALRQAAAQNLWSCFAVVWPELCTMTQESFSSDLSMAEQWQKLRTAKIVLLDDFDKTSISPWAMEKLFAIINFRQDKKSKKITIITANKTLQELRYLWGSSAKPHLVDTGTATLSRIVGMTTAIVECRGEDQRWA